MRMRQSRRQLDRAQLQIFKRGSTEPRLEFARLLVERICAAVEDPDRPLALVDLGGGDGRILDGCLEALPRARGTLVELAGEMVDANVPHPRKTTLQGDLLHLESLLPAGEQYDLILFNVVLHHCLGTTAAASRALQQRVLGEASRRLTSTGRVVVVEQIHESPVFPGLASRVIYYLTRSRLLAPLVRHGGANTAGVGVLFASEKRLLRLYDDAGLAVVGLEVVRTGRRRWMRMLIGITRSHQTLYVLEPRARAGV